jgi:hypothetical protein
VNWKKAPADQYQDFIARVKIALGMLPSRRFYKELGNLFYAIAMADKHISDRERKSLDDEIQFSWKHFDSSTDRFGSDRAFLIEFEFESMEEQFESAGHAYESFETYFREEGARIDRHTRERIFLSARHIAESMRKINQDELRYLVRLKKLLEV